MRRLTQVIAVMLVVGFALGGVTQGRVWWLEFSE